MKNMLFLALAAILMTACSTPQIQFPSDLSGEMVEYEVKGRTGFVLNQVIEYGDYKSSKINRGWRKGYSSDFILKFEGASEKMNFSQFQKDTGIADVYAIGKFKRTEIRWLSDFFDVILSEKNYFAGTINSDRKWDFIVYDPSGGGNLENTTSGQLKSSNGEVIEIRGIKKMEDNKAKLFALEVKGYEFLFQGEVIGVVSLIQKGKVWIKDDLRNDIELGMTSVMTALMVRSDLE